jgi:hypothetical protein
MVDIIERKLGHNNEAMLEYCNTLRDILMQTKEVKSGRGKSVEFRRVLKYKNDIEALDRIIKSCEHYKKLNDMENKKIGSLEIVKYRFEKINGEPKIIIEMIKVLDTDGNYIKFAKLEGVVDFLSKYPIKFKEL